MDCVDIQLPPHLSGDRSGIAGEQEGYTQSFLGHPVLVHGRSMMTGRLAHWTPPGNTAAARGTDSSTMRYLAYCEEMRHWQELALYAAVSAEDVLLWGDPAEVSRLQGFLDRAVAPLQHEEIHGRGSLLDLDHPDVEHLLEIAKLGRPHADPVQVIAHGYRTRVTPCSSMASASADTAA